MGIGLPAGHQAGVRGQRQWNRRQCLIEPHAGGGEAIEIRRGRSGIAVRADAICARRIERDEQDVRLCGVVAERGVEEPPDEQERLATTNDAGREGWQAGSTCRRTARLQTNQTYPTYQTNQT